MHENEHLLELRNISKSFPGVKALDNVHFDLRAGELHALLGENGAGKSTLIKILAGIYPKDSGQILYCGREVEIHGVQDARNLNISVIHQEISLVPQLTVADNILLGTEGKNPFINKKKRRELARQMVESVGYEFDVDAKVGSLSIAQQQIVEIVRALAVHNTKIMIMDEPTASISESDAQKLFRTIERLKSNGIGIIYISHRMEEVLQIADRITVFRDGQYVGTRGSHEVGIQEIIRMMTGRTLDQTSQYNIRNIGDTLLELRDVQNSYLRGVNFTLRKGEIHGLYGLIGSGRTELARAIFGIDPSSGAMFIRGSAVNIRSPRDAMRLGIALVPENRKGEGLSLMHSVLTNSILTTARSYVYHLRVHKKKIAEFLAREKERLNIKYSSPERRVATLSGGNQQKIVLSKWLATQPEILILDEPTRGIDIGSKYEIYDLIFRLAEQGKSIILISSELPEIINLCSRVSIMREGRIVKTLDREAFSQETMLSYALSMNPSHAQGDGDSL